MASTAFQGFDDPYAYNYEQSLTNAMNANSFNTDVDSFWGTSGIVGLARKLGGEDLDWKKQRAMDQMQKEYERASIQSARAWSKYLDDTQYQRRVEDLKKAGLNPWLAVQNGISGSGAATVDTGGSAKNQTKSDQSASILGSLIMAIAKILS